MMSAADVIDVVSTLSAADVSFWLDGGWGVDALLGEETRRHDDLDIVIRLDDSESAIDHLVAVGFHVETDSRPTRLVLGDANGRRIDLHPVVHNPDGSARQLGAGPSGGDAPYPADGFNGEGHITGRAVACLTPTLLVLHHTGYEPQDKDRHNVTLLCERFGIVLPPAYQR
jgi:lincosamide nucleotidyltransferase A/C/D/E